MTECTQQGFAFEGHFSRRVVAEFSGDRLTTEGGALLLREADRKIALLRRVADCFTDTRQPERVEHRLPEMLAQRIYGLALGYEDLNDHEQLRNDPLLAVLAGKQEIEKSLAGKSTLNRLELTPSGSPLTERYHKIGYSPTAIDELLVKIFLEAHRRAPKQIVLDLDATDTPLHGKQEGRFFHGYYGSPRTIHRERALLLPSVVHLLRGSPAVLPAATVQPGCVGREYHGTGTDRSADPRAVAEGAGHLARGLRVLPRGTDDLVRIAPRGLCVWLRAQ